MMKKGFKHTELTKEKMRKPHKFSLRKKREICKNGHLFSDTRKTEIGGNSVCGECKRARARDDYRKNTDKWKMFSRKTKLKRAYGLSIEQFDQLILSQGGKCLICGDKLLVGTNQCCVDHNHQTGTIRGILCSRCNTGIGLLREDKRIFLAAINYLK